MARRILIKALSLVLAAVSAGARWVRAFLESLGSPAKLLATIRSRRVLWPWMTQLVKLFIGTLAYNAFALIFVQPLLRKWFPPLKPWEQVAGLFGSSRMTYEEIVPVVATTLWIVGNALLFALLNRDLRKAQSTLAHGGTVTRLDSRVRAAR